MIQQQQQSQDQFRFVNVKTENSVNGRDLESSNHRFYQQSFGNKNKQKIQESSERKQNYPEKQTETRIKLVSSFQSSYLQNQQSKLRETFEQNTKINAINEQHKVNIPKIANAEMTNSSYTIKNQKKQFKSRKQDERNTQAMLKNVHEQVKEEQFLLNLEREVHKYLLQRIKTRGAHSSILNSKSEGQIKSSAIDFLHFSQEYLNNIEKMKR